MSDFLRFKELKGKIQLIKDEKKKFEILNLTQSLDTITITKEVWLSV